MQAELTTLCYIEKDDQYLMLHRVKKDKDINKDKWIGVGGHMETGESPDDCLIREVREETGLVLTDFSFRAIVTFVADNAPLEYMCLYTAVDPGGTLLECTEGDLAYIKKTDIKKLQLWEGDYIFLKLLEERDSFFSLKLIYKQDTLTDAILDGRPMELFDICNEEGQPTGQVRERNVIHSFGNWHRTSHVWVVRPTSKGYDILLQKRSQGKDSFPGCFDISSAGHIRAGDEYRSSAVRELQEELGIKAQEEELRYIGMHKGEIQTEFYNKPFVNREVSAIFIYDKPFKDSELVLQKEEVESVMWMDSKECLQKVQTKQMSHCIFLDEIQFLVNELSERE